MTNGDNKTSLTNEHLRQALAENGHQLSPDQLDSLMNLLQEAGSLEHAEAAVAELRRMREAA